MREDPVNKLANLNVVAGAAAATVWLPQLVYRRSPPDVFALVGALLIECWGEGIAGGSFPGTGNP